MNKFTNKIYILYLKLYVLSIGFQLSISFIYSS